MKAIASRFAALLLVLALAASALPFAALAAGPLTYTVRTDLGQGLTLTQGNGYTDAGKLRQLFTLDYTPGGNVRPLVLYGTYINGKSTIGTVVAYAESMGYRVLAAVNSDFFFMGSGVPTGMTIQNGRLASSDGGWNAVGFFEDGTAIAGTPKLSITLTGPDGAERPIHALNNVRTSAGIYLYTQDFDATTATTAAGTEVVLEPVKGDPLRLGRKLKARVVSTAHTSSTPIGPNQLVLSLTDSCTAGVTLSDLTAGDEVTLYAATEDPAWNDVVWGSGGGNMLARNGQLTSDATAEVAPRTVLGIREDGSVRILECDGRQAALSTGISLIEAAQLLLAEGCVTVINLDGGGSSILAAAYPGKATAVLSSPSEGSPRACATYLLFVTEGDGSGSASGRAWGSTVYPRSATLLAGAFLPVSAISYHKSYLNFADVTDDLTADGGWVSGGIYYAPHEAGTYQVFTSRLESQPALYTVTDAVASLKLTVGGKAVSALTLEPGSVTDLNVLASDGIRSIICSDDQFSFAVTGDIGTIDTNGVFTAARRSGSGSITCAYGSTVCTVAVTLEAKPASLLSDLDSVSLGIYGNAQAQVLQETQPENIRYGKGSVKLSYTGADGQLAEYLFPEAIALEKVSHVSVMAKGSGQWYFLFAPADSTASLLAQPLTAEGDSWQTVFAEVPQDAVSLLGFARRGAGSGTLWLDQLCAHYGAMERDVTPPVINIQSTEGTLQASVTDDSGSLSSTGITVAIDGAAAAFQYSGGVLTCALPTDGARHRITVTARDAMGNLSRQSTEIGQAAAPSFSDMNGHWAAAAVEYLHGKGVFSDAEQFRPGDQVNNAMAATMLSRYLGVDVTQYENTVLPYTDAAKIPDWALPHVKAMYALGMMKGSTDAAGRSVLNPGAACSRAQIMTMLGRTLTRGYAYAPCTYADAGQIPAWSRDHLDLLSALGIVTGNEKNQVNPNGTITRAEFAALLYRMY